MLLLLFLLTLLLMLMLQPITGIILADAWLLLGEEECLALSSDSLYPELPIGEYWTTLT